MSCCTALCSFVKWLQIKSNAALSKIQNNYTPLFFTSMEEIIEVNSRSGSPPESSRAATGRRGTKRGPGQDSDVNASAEASSSSNENPKNTIEKLRKDVKMQEGLQNKLVKLDAERNVHVENLEDKVKSLGNVSTSLQEATKHSKEAVKDLKEEVKDLKKEFVDLSLLTNKRIDEYKKSIDAAALDRMALTRCIMNLTSTQNKFLRASNQEIKAIPFANGLMPGPEFPVIKECLDIDNLTKVQCWALLDGHEIRYTLNETVNLKKKLREFYGLTNSVDLAYVFRGFPVTHGIPDVLESTSRAT